MSEDGSELAREEGRKEGILDTASFLTVANRFIDLANQENTTVNATDLHMAFLYGSARYSAYVGKAILQVDDDEAYVEHMVEQYRQMLRRHLADQALAEPTD